MKRHGPLLAFDPHADRVPNALVFHVNSLDENRWLNNASPACAVRQEALAGDHGARPQRAPYQSARAARL